MTTATSIIKGRSPDHLSPKHLPGTLEALKIALASTYALYLKTQAYHWNVVAPNFMELHGLLEDHYTALADAVDDIAERIRALRDSAPASFGIFAKLSRVSDNNTAQGAKAILQDLIEGHTRVWEVLDALRATAAAEDDPITEDFAIGRLAYHEKTLWMLRSYGE